MTDLLQVHYSFVKDRLTLDARRIITQANGDSREGNPVN